ncbi:MAG: BadF/BadG/BcrA/BcrD ATPase family protein [Lentisphaeria bacterium]
MKSSACEMPYVCAFDSGGSKTFCWIAAADGTILARQTGIGAANIHDEEILKGILTPTLQATLKEAKLQESQLAAVNVCLGGLNEKAMQNALQNLLPESRIQVIRESSGEAIFAGAAFWGFNIALMAGTGVVAVGINSAGRKCSIGGWGPLMYDLGGGFAIAQQALHVLAETIDFRLAPTLLLPALARTAPFAQALEPCQFLDKAPADMSYEERLTLKNGIKSVLPQLDRRTVAGLFPIVCECAKQKDPAAQQILEHASEILVKVTNALAVDLELTAPKITPIGGIFKAGELVSQPYQLALRKVLPKAELVFCDFTQIHGSVLLALQLAGLPLSAAQVAKIRRA